MDSLEACPGSHHQLLVRNQDYQAWFGLPPSSTHRLCNFGSTSLPGIERKTMVYQTRIGTALWMLSKILFFNDEMSTHSIPLLVTSNKKMTPLRWVPVQLFVCSQCYLCTWYPLCASDQKYAATQNHGHGRYFFWLTNLLNRHFIKWATEQSLWLFSLLFFRLGTKRPSVRPNIANDSLTDCWKKNWREAAWWHLINSPFPCCWREGNIASRLTNVQTWWNECKKLTPSILFARTQEKIVCPTSHNFSDAWRSQLSAEATKVRVTALPKGAQGSSSIDKLGRWDRTLSHWTVHGVLIYLFEG